jgi:hypothetical protein
MSDEMKQRQSIREILDSFRGSGVSSQSQGQEVGRENLGNLRPAPTPEVSRPANDTPAPPPPGQSLGGPYRPPSLSR